MILQCRLITHYGTLDVVKFSTYKIINAKREKIWRIISDVDNDTAYWFGIKKIKNLRKEVNSLERETVIAFRKSTCLELVTFSEGNEINFNIIKGPIVGNKTLKILEVSEQECKLEVNWEIRLQGLMSMFVFIVRKHILKGTQESLERIDITCEKS